MRKPNSNCFKLDSTSNHKFSLSIQTYFTFLAVQGEQLEDWAIHKISSNQSNENTDFHLDLNNQITRHKPTVVQF